MANFKLVISDPKTRKAYQKEVDQAASGLIGKKIGDSIPADSIGLEGYKIELTGGSDKEGFPMRKDVDGSSRKKIILSHPPGFHPAKKGQKKRKSIRGNTVSEAIAQINVKVVDHGKKSIEELLGIKKEKKEEKKPAEEKGPSKEAPKEEKKEAAEEKKEEPKEPVKEAPKEEKKEEPKEETAAKAEEKMGVKKLE